MPEIDPRLSRSESKRSASMPKESFSGNFDKIICRFSVIEAPVFPFLGGCTEFMLFD